MKGRSEFTGYELERLRVLARENETAPPDRQKVLRTAMRDELDFYAEDGFGEADLDDLLERGAISIRITETLGVARLFPARRCLPGLRVVWYTV
jgi:hypothetical protein